MLKSSLHSALKIRIPINSSIKPELQIHLALYGIQPPIKSIHHSEPSYSIKTLTEVKFSIKSPENDFEEKNGSLNSIQSTLIHIYEFTKLGFEKNTIN